jgi:hypothetical protein
VGARWLAGAALLVVAGAGAAVTAPLVRTVARKASRAPLAGVLLVCALGWLTVALVADGLVVATGRWLLLDVVGAVALVGGFVQAIVATLLHVVTMWLPRPRRLRRSSASTRSRSVSRCSRRRSSASGRSRCWPEAGLRLRLRRGVLRLRRHPLPSAPMPRSVAAALVFLSSAAVLILEILAARLLAPYVGVTLEVYTAIIGVILAGIAVGSWLGGRAADRVEPHGLLGPLLIAGGALSFVTIPLIDGLGGGLRGGGPAATTILTFVAFFAPAAVLTAVTPAVIKIQLADLAQTGRVVGRLSAIGTVGALFGVFLAGFVLVAAAPDPAGDPRARVAAGRARHRDDRVARSPPAGHGRHRGRVGRRRRPVLRRPSPLRARVGLLLRLRGRGPRPPVGARTLARHVAPQLRRSGGPRPPRVHLHPVVRGRDRRHRPRR